MKQPVLFVIPEQFADYEYPFPATALQDHNPDRITRYKVKTVSATKNPVQSIGGACQHGCSASQSPDFQQ